MEYGYNNVSLHRVKTWPCLCAVPLSRNQMSLFIRDKERGR